MNGRDEQTLPSGWRTASLKDHIHVKHGFAFKSAYFGTRGPHALLTPGNFHDEGGFKVQGDKQKRYDGPIPRGFVLQPGDLVVAMTEQAEGLLGSSAIIPEGDTYLHNQRIGVVTSETLHRRYLFYLFNYKPIRDQISASASGTKVRHTSPTRLGEVCFALPPFDTQRRIADILSVYDELIQVNTRRMAILEEMVHRLFDEWFARRQFPGHKTEGFVKGRPESSPEYWRTGSLNDVAELVGTSINPRTMPDRLFTHFSIPSFDAGKRPVVEKGSQILSNKFIFSPPVVLISKLNPRIPRVWRVEETRGDAAICSTEFLPLRPNSEIGTAWLTALCTSEPFIGLVKGLAQGTSTSHQRARHQDVLALPIIIPPRALLQRADRILGDNFDLISTLLNANCTLHAARDLLLPKLISGEIDLSGAEREMERAPDQVAAE